jgi:predicted ATPase/class 3 adenylate cyclase
VSVRVGRDGWYPRSFLLTDIVGSVSMWEREPGQMSVAVARHDALVGGSVAAAGGTLVRSKGEGDSTFSVFAHPTDAVACAVAVQDAVAAESWPTATPLRVRAGVHTGDGEPRDGDWYGPAVNRAARLRALAEGAQTLVSGVTAGLVADQLPAGVRLLYRGRRVLRGIERPEEVWELVAANDPRLAFGASVRMPALPVALTSFIGRSEDVEHLVQLVGDVRLVTLTGPGGCGKTRLALEVARDAQRRGEVVWLAELAPLRDGWRVGDTVAALMGFQTAADPLQELLAHPEVAAGLLVLDNCEHLLDACSMVTRQLIAASADLRVLATSREPLGLAGERTWPLRPLAVPAATQRDRDELAGIESVMLLLDRARAVRPDLEVGDDDVGPVVQICQALDGMPLAIELAAGRLRSLSFAGLAGRLTDQLAVLTRSPGASGDDARHRSLGVAIDWSYALLTDEQRTLARQLSVCVGGFRLDAVEALSRPDVDVLDAVDELVAKSLITFDGVTARYRLLEPLRQYLAGRLEESGETEAAHRAHAEWVARLCERLGTRLLEDQRPRAERLREEKGNIDVALRWAVDHREHDVALRIVGSLGQYWFFYDQATGRRWCPRVVDAGGGASPRRRAKALLSAGVVAQNDGAWDRSIAWLREALAIYRTSNATAGEAASLYWLGRALSNGVRRLDLDERGATEAIDCFERGRRLFTQLGDWIGASWCQIFVAFQALDDDDLDRAETLSQQVIEQCNAAGVRHPMGQAFCNLAIIAHLRGHHAVATDFLENAVAIYRELDDPWQLAGLLVELAAQAASAGRGHEALKALAESTRLDEQIGRLPGRSYVLGVAAVVHLARDQTDLAVAALGAFEAHSKLGILETLLRDPVDETRARLDPAAVAAAATTARTRKLHDLIDELISLPASSSG